MLNKASHLHGDFSPGEETNKYLGAQGRQRVERMADWGGERVNANRIYEMRILEVGWRHHGEH